MLLLLKEMAREFQEFFTGKTPGCRVQKTHFFKKAQPSGFVWV